MMIKSLLKPAKASSGVIMRKLARIISMMSVTISIESFSVAKSTTVNHQQREHKGYFHKSVRINPGLIVRGNLRLYVLLP